MMLPESSTLPTADLLALLEERAAQKRIRDEADRRMTALSDQIGALLTAHDLTHLEIGPFTVRLVQQPRETLSKHRLLELGVPLDTIKAATVTTTSVHVRVTERPDTR